MKKTLALVLCLVALPAAAHGGHAGASGLVAGLAHPFTGIDHLLAMLGVGIWSGRQKQRWTLPLCFLLMMALGALAQGAAVLSEPAVLASALLVGALLLAKVRLPAGAAIALVAGCALLHGQAHGSELPGLATAAGYLGSCALLLLAGRGLGGMRSGACPVPARAIR
ncbi:HupE/UreJ family protein [Massilia glaciei]|uniref:HupE-UreJ family metal transporter n=1 Tax=Massilia glaciei TaxID=1524097 RepID=A0A2U2I679_9BURK|nr:HupE/UreJ family protein [Massilia glaciei]PWF55263.1 HupE-UreJ family metal transporter [Massilia glaciei]